MARCTLACVLLTGFFALNAVAQNLYSGKTFRVSGKWNGSDLEADRIQLREAESDATRVRISGHIDDVDLARHTMRIGPLRIEWDDKTEFDAITQQQLQPGLAVRVTGKAKQPVALRAGKIEREASKLGSDEVQVTAQAQALGPAVDGRERIRMAGVPVRLAGVGYNRVESLTRRQDSRRPDRPFSVNLAGRPLTITGEYDLQYRERNNFRLDDSARSNLDQELVLEFFYPYGEHTYFFAEAKPFLEHDLRRTDGKERTSDSGVRRGQAWVFIDGLARHHMGLQLGRQNFKETREWWWDDDLDAARAYFDHGPLHFELSTAQELARESSSDKGIAPEKKDVRRVIGHASWLWASRQALEVYALHQNDRSSDPSVGATLRERDQDASDANLTWLGVRAIGQRSLNEAGAIKYWADVGMVRGRETVISFGDAGGGLSSVDERVRRDVRGSAYDVGVSWQTPFALTPAITLAYASGSGDGDAGDGTDHNFRQTGLHNNKARFFGVNRFRYYGELLRPELSNLSIGTLALGVPFLNNSSVEWVYHRYRQNKAADFLRDVKIDADLNGTSRDVGEEMDLVFGVREGARLDLAFVASRFKAGDAYGARSGERAYLWLFEATYNF